MDSPTIATIIARIDAVRSFCQDQIEYDQTRGGAGLTNRSWCAQGVLNILDGQIDWQF